MHGLRLDVLEDVVSQADNELLAAGERLRHADDLGDSSGLGLHLVGEIEVEQEHFAVAPSDLAVAEEVDEIAAVLLSRDEQDVPDAEQLEQLERE